MAAGVLSRDDDNSRLVSGKKPDSHFTDLHHPWRRIRARRSPGLGAIGPSGKTTLTKALNAEAVVTRHGGDPGEVEVFKLGRWVPEGDE